jgi:DedD protein
LLYNGLRVEHGLMEMARPISDEELQLRKRARRRLIGAIVAVTAVVVALPMILDNEPKPVNQDIDIRIPSPDSGLPFTSKVVPVPDAGTEPKPSTPAKPAPESKPEPREAQNNTAAKPQPAPPSQDTAKAAVPVKPQPAPPTQDAAKAAAPAKPEPPPAKAAGAASGQYVVQVVALSDARKAKQMQQQIVAAGVKSYTEVVKTARGDVTRVRAGPFATREAAEKAQQKLKSAGFEGKVVPAK